MARVRMDWMDTLRGFAVLAVMSMHARMITAHVAGVDLHLVHEVDRALVPVRMPLLMVLSGALLARSLAKGRREHYLGKVRGILWPYAVWMGLYLAYLAVRRLSEGEPFPWYAVGQAFYNPAGYIWFLGYLFAYHALAGVMPAAVRTAAVPIAFGLHHVVASQPQHDVDLSRFLWLLPYFLLGDVLARLLAGRIPVGVTTAANRLSVAPLAAIGRSSITYYVPHMLLMYAAVPLLWHVVGLRSPVLVWMLAVVSALAVGWAFSGVQHEPGWRWLFGWPRRPRRTAPGPGGQPPSSVHPEFAPA